MKTYWIRTFAREDRPEMVCSYPYPQWMELIEEFTADGIRFTYWSE